jgi:outer membrane biosynthesis protein TonB
MTMSRNHVVGIIISLFLHIGLAFLLFVPSAVKQANRPVNTVTIVPAKTLETKKQRIIVPDIQTDTVEKPQDTNQLSARNVSVKKEMVNRKVKMPSKSPRQKSSVDKIPRKPSGHSRQPQPDIKTKTSKTNYPQLNLNLDTSLLNISPNKPAAKHHDTSIRPFSRAANSGAVFLDSPTLDSHNTYIKDLPDGDLTLLNSKAYKYAVFVQRVAIRVFAALRRTGWMTLSKDQIDRISRNTVILASLDKQGRVVAIKLTENSGSPQFDEAVKSAAQSASDPNPPLTARNESGNIVFEFHARTWSQITPGKRGGLNERRWLYLGTGLQ